MIVLYSTHCPKCKALEILLGKKNIPYEVIDNQEEVVKVGQAQRILTAPILRVDDEFFDFSKAVKFINEQ